jgi:hypothetical protein
MIFLFISYYTFNMFRLSVQQSPADTSEARNDESVLEGALAVQPLSRNLAGFDTYFKSLGPNHGAINPWFEESLREYCKRQHSGGHYRLPSLQVRFLAEYRRLPLSYSSGASHSSLLTLPSVEDNGRLWYVPAFYLSIISHISSYN